MASSPSPIGCLGRVTRHGAIRPGRTGEVMVEMGGGVQAFMARDADGGSIDADEVVIPILIAVTLKMLYKVPAADQALIVTGGGAKARRPTPRGGPTRSSPAAARSSSRCCRRRSTSR